MSDQELVLVVAVLPESLGLVAMCAAGVWWAARAMVRRFVWRWKSWPRKVRA